MYTNTICSLYSLKKKKKRYSQSIDGFVTCCCSGVKSIWLFQVHEWRSIHSLKKEEQKSILILYECKIYVECQINCLGEGNGNV